MIVIPNIPIVFSGQFPKNYVNDVADWSFSREELIQNKRKLLTMDIDFSSEEQCSLNCSHCYSHNELISKSETAQNEEQDENSALSYNELLDVIRQAKELGIRSIKLLGRGEHTEHPRLIEFLEHLKQIDIIPLIFTKGHVIGDDELVKRYYGHRGVFTGEYLVAKLNELNARILLGFRSFDTEKEDKSVGNIKGYSLKRNRTLEILVGQGFNQHNPTRMGLMTIPVTTENVDEAFEIYVYGKERNMYVCVAPTMVSGRGTKIWKRNNMNPSRQQLVDLYTKIYVWNIQKGIQTLEQLKEEGISAYAGSPPCQQTGCGVYVTLFGDVYLCPGDDSHKAKFGNIREKPLKDIWELSPNYLRAGSFNCYCPAKDERTIPSGFYSEVLHKVEQALNHRQQIR